MIKKANIAVLISRIIFALLIIYGIISLYIFFWGSIRILPGLRGIEEDSKWIYFSIISFVMVIIISVFHLGKTILLQKRK